MLLRLPLAVLIFSQLVYLGGNPSSDGYLISSEEVAVSFSERDDSKSSYLGLPGGTFKDALIQHFDWISLGLGYVLQGAVLELRATGPPNV